ncbi:MAG: response regulator transcription factor [Rikenellaceae bacterium]|nr:response regulator transcription factor [Rikenellaceae bacterium]
MRRFRVAIIEPSAIIAEGVATLAGRSGEFEVVYSGGDMRMLIERFAMVSPDVVIVGSQMVGANNQSLRVAYPELQSVTLALLSTTVCDEEVMRQFDGVVNIYDGQAQIIRKLHAAVEQGETNPYSDSHDLSERERDVLILVAKGKTNKEIADELNISIHTVMSHRKNITHKTGIKSVAGLTVYALLNNLLDQNDVTL